jgi:hypothetical protein
MPAPKRLRIVDAIAVRAATIGDTIYRDRREPQADELPCLLIYSGDRIVDVNHNRRGRCEMTVTVAGYRRLDSGESETIGNEILADIMTAVELEDETLGGLVLTNPGLSVATESIYLPETGDNVVAAEIVYSVPHVRVDGDPEII